MKLHRLTSKTMWRSLTFHQSWSELSNTLTLHPALPKTRLHSDSDNTRHRKLTNLTASHRYRAVYRFVIGKDSEKSFDVASVLLLKKKHVFMTRCGFWLWNSVQCTNSHKSKRVHLVFDVGGKFKSLTVLTTTTNLTCVTLNHT